MSDFDRQFRPLKQMLDDPEARFGGEAMRDALLALVPSVPDRAAEAMLCRELAVLEGKRGMVECLDHAERALAAQADTGVLTPLSLYFMHQLCGDVGTAWANEDDRTTAHLDRALVLHGELGRPTEEGFFLRFNRGVHARARGLDRHGLDWFEPLLADAEARYGARHLELVNLLYQMSQSEKATGNEQAALHLLERQANLDFTTGDRGRRVTALIGYADELARQGRGADARAALDEAVADAREFASSATVSFAQEQRRKILSTVPRGLSGRLRALFGRG